MYLIKKNFIFALLKSSHHSFERSFKKSSSYIFLCYEKFLQNLFGENPYVDKPYKTTRPA